MSRCHDCRMAVPIGALVCPFCRTDRAWDGRRERGKDTEMDNGFAGIAATGPAAAVVMCLLVVVVGAWVLVVLVPLSLKYGYRFGVRYPRAALAVIAAQVAGGVGYLALTSGGR